MKKELEEGERGGLYQPEMLVIMWEQDELRSCALTAPHYAAVKDPRDFSTLRSKV
jgi:hypothetical protein